MFLERLELCCLALERAIQPRILERGRRLTGEHIQEVHVLARKRALVPPTTEKDDADDLVVRTAGDGVLQVLDGDDLTALAPGNVTRRVPLELAVIDRFPVREPGVQRRVFRDVHAPPLLIRESVTRLDAEPIHRRHQERHPLDLEGIANALYQARRQMIEI